MLVPSMTPEEVYAEVLRDADALLRKSMAKSYLYQDELRRKGKQYEIRREQYETPHHNKWTLLYRVFPHITWRMFYTHAMDSIGPVVYSMDFYEGNERKMEVAKYNGHFWKRYRERAYPQLTKFPDLVKSFFNHNQDFSRGVTQELEDGSSLISYVTEEGMSVGWHLKEKKFVHMKTFMSHNMLNEKQQNLAALIIEHGDIETFLSSVNVEQLKNKF